MKPFVVGLTGGSGSGKTFILKYLLDQLSGSKASALCQDNYYIARENQPTDENGIKNFDLPESISLSEFHSDLRKLKSGEQLSRREYTYNNPGVKPSVIEIKPAPILFVEGIFIFSDARIDGELDYRIFVEAKTDIMLDRRLKRDFIERGYDEDDVNYRYHNHVIPTYNEYIGPYKHKADVIIQNNQHQQPDLTAILSFLNAKTA